MAGELQVGARPQELIPGNPDDVDRLARRLRTFADGMGDAAGRFGAISADEWKGEAANAFRSLIVSHPKKYADAAASFSSAATALIRYAEVLREAQAQAQRAIELHEQAQAQTQDWQSQRDRYDADVRAAAGNGTTPASPPPPGADPGAGDRGRAQHLLDDANSMVKQQAHQSSAQLAAAAHTAPHEPGLLDSVMGGIGDFFGGAADGLAGGWGAMTATLGDIGGFVADGWDGFVGWAEALGPSLAEIALGGVMIVGGAMMLSAAAAMGVGGVVLDATGVGAVVGVPLNLGAIALGGGGIILIGGGAALVAHGLSGLTVAFAARKGDLREVDQAARRHGIKDRRAFGRFIEEEKRHDPGSKNERGDYTKDELDQKAEEYKEEGGK